MPLAPTATKLLLSAAVLLLASQPVCASIIHYNFEVNIDNDGSALAGQTFFGSASFEDQLNFEPLISFSFDFVNGDNTGPKIYTEADDPAAGAAFDGAGGAFEGIEYFFQQAFTSVQFQPAFGAQPAVFAYQLDPGDLGDSGFGTVSYTQVAEVPLPGTAWLMLPLLTLVGASRYRLATRTRFSSNNSAAQ